MTDADRLTATLLRARLAGTRLPPDPTDITPPSGAERWPQETGAQPTRSLTPAGVLVPVVERGAALSVLLTQRSIELKHHAGQISFPGGRMEAEDRDIEATALRETHEEVGIAPGAVTVIGYLRPMPTLTGYAVTPVVGLVASGASLTLDRTEVEYAFEAPLDYLLDKRNQTAALREVRGRRVPTSEFHYEGRRIWGATANILVELRKVIFKQ